MFIICGGSFVLEGPIVLSFSAGRNMNDSQGFFFGEVSCEELVSGIRGSVQPLGLFLVCQIDGGLLLAIAGALCGSSGFAGVQLWEFIWKLDGQGRIGLQRR